MSGADTCGQLWTTVDCACGKLASRARDSMPGTKDKSLVPRDPLVDNLLAAVDLLAARVDGLQYSLDRYWSIIDSPLSPAESIERLRALRDELGHPK